MTANDARRTARRIGFTIANHHTSDGETGMFSLLILAVPAGLHLPPPAQFVTRTTWPLLPRRCSHGLRRNNRHELSDSSANACARLVVTNHETMMQLL